MARTYKAKLDNLGEMITRVLKDYGDNVTEGMKEAVKTVANNAKEETKAASPVNNRGSRRGRYRKGWYVKGEEERLSYSAIVHNRTDYQLTHLLEKGHAKRGGGRTKAIPHIGPAEERAIKEIERAVIRLAQG